MIIQKGVRCYICGGKIFSNYRHDFKTCECGHTSVDGGFNYIRIEAPENMPPIMITRLYPETQDEKWIIDRHGDQFIDVLQHPLFFCYPKSDLIIEEMKWYS